MVVLERATDSSAWYSRGRYAPATVRRPPLFVADDDDGDGGRDDDSDNNNNDDDDDDDDDDNSTHTDAALYFPDAASSSSAASGQGWWGITAPHSVQSPTPLRYFSHHVSRLTSPSAQPPPLQVCFACRCVVFARRL